MGGYMSMGSEQCWSIHDCLGDRFGYFWHFNGTSWKKAAAYESGLTGAAMGFACFSKTDCVAAGGVPGRSAAVFRFR
jgi:hypothetical protein